MSWQVGLYVAAVLIPLAAFAVQVLGIRLLGRLNAYVATGAIFASFVLSLIGFLAYFGPIANEVFADHHAEHQEGPALPAAVKVEAAHASEAPAAGEAHAAEAGPDGHAPRKGPLAWSESFDWVALGAGTVGVEDKAASSTEPLRLSLDVYVDNLTAIMFLMVTFIATLIHVYSMGYMHDDPRYPRFFAYLSLFCFSMLGLVASGNVFMVFTFWELVGVCSYFLIGFWYEEKKNSDAANKAFITNRVGDVGMLVGLGLIWSCLGTFNIHEINTTIRDADGHLNITEGAGGAGQVAVLKDQGTGATLVDSATGKPRQIATWVLAIAGLGIFAGCVGKSAQFPLHVWLPDAMAGPTPVSALIHAATMVAAGVYLVGRFYPLFTGEVLLYIAYTGGITLFIGATIATVQTDYKKVLAYSTVSQLGFMMLGLGTGGWAAGLFHLITHAFFKALLFLGAGSIYHSVHTYEMPALGGLRKKMPLTALTMLLATCAISGVPLFSGFYSKDAILASSLYLVRNRPQHILLFILPVVGAALTAFYMFRMWYLVFAGESRGFPKSEAHGHGHHDGHGHHHGNPVDHAHESGPLMLWPLLVLAVPTVAIGFPWTILPIGEPILEQMLTYGEPLRGTDFGSVHLLAMGASLLIATVGIGLGTLYYAPPMRYTPRRRFSAQKAAARMGPVHRFLVNKWYFDELYQAVLVKPVLGAARGVSSLDRVIVDGVVNGAAGLTVLVSKLEGFFDKFAVDGLVNLTARATYALGDWGRGIQTGRLRSYLMVLAVAVVGLFAGVFAWVR